MKKLALLNIFLVALFFTSCEPNELIYEELDNATVQEDLLYEYNIGKEVAGDAYTLTDDDYALSSNEDIAKYKNFSSSNLPKDYLPEILNAKFTAEDGFAMSVTYNYYEKPTVDENSAHEISDEEYGSMGRSYSNFDDEEAAEALIAKLLDRTTYNNEAGDETTVLYTLYAKSQTRYVKVNADKTTEVLDYSSDAYELVDADYADLGYGKYNNFSYIDQAEAGAVELATLRSHSLPKEYSCLVYSNYLDKYVVYIFDGTNWQVKQSVMPVSEALNFALNTEDVTNSTWWADPALKITLGVADYDLYSETAKYQNFDLRGSVAPGTDRDKLIEMITGMLDANHSPVDDQQYLVSYAYYDGGNGVGTVRLVRTAGVWSEATLDL